MVKGEWKPMDKNRAIELLKQYLTEVSHLRTLPYDNEDFKLWLDKVRTVIKAALDPDDNAKFKSWRAIHIRGMFSNDVYQNDYLGELTDYETALKSIIQKYVILGIETPATQYIISAELPPKAFISHGKESVALTKIEKFLRALGIEPLIVKEQPSLDKTTDDKVNYYLSQANFVIILATGDDKIEDKLHPRQNVIHEIGLAQKTHSGKIIYLLEENTEFPSNISPKVWERFNQENMENVFLRIIIELRGFQMLVWPA
jgi:predicted nucleotide-binding protein